MPTPKITAIPRDHLETWNEQLAELEQRDRGEQPCPQCDGSGKDEDGQVCGDCAGSGADVGQTLAYWAPSEFVRKAAREISDVTWCLCDFFAGVAVRGLPATPELAERLKAWRTRLTPAVLALAADLEDLASALDEAAPKWPPPAPLVRFEIVETEEGADASLSIGLEGATNGAIDGHLACFHALRFLHGTRDRLWRWRDDLYPKAGRVLVEPGLAGRWAVFTNDGGILATEATRMDAIAWTRWNLTHPRGVIIFKVETEERLARFLATAFRHLRGILGDRVPGAGSDSSTETGTAKDRIVATLREQELNESAKAEPHQREAPAGEVLEPEMGETGDLYGDGDGDGDGENDGATAIEDATPREDSLNRIGKSAMALVETVAATSTKRGASS